MSTRTPISLILPAALACACALLLPLPGHAAERAGAQPAGQLLEVNSLADPGTGTCDTTECTLREALAAAVAGAGHITFASGLSGTIVLGSQLEIATDQIQINGPGPGVISISGNDTHRVLEISGSSVELRDLTVRDGNAGSGTGGGILITGAGPVLLEHLRVIDSQTTFFGGGIHAGATTTVRNSEVSGNSANGGGGGIYFSGREGDDLLIENTTISSNTSDVNEGGLRVEIDSGQTATLRHVTVAENDGSRGVGLSGDGSALIEGSLLADNGTDLVNAVDDFVIINSVVENPSGGLYGENTLADVYVEIGALDFFEGSDTKVHPISADPARDHVDNAVGSGGCGTEPTHDQRGAARPIGPRCDAGAFEAPAPNMLASWDFEEFAPGQVLADGGRVDDSSDNLRDARIGDGSDLPTTIPGFGERGTALAFSDSADRVVFEPGYDFVEGPAAGPAIELAADDSFTVEAVVRIPEGSTQVATLVEHDPATGQPAWWLRVQDGEVQAQVDDGVGQTTVTGLLSIDDGRWHHVAMVRDAVADLLRVYVDYRTQETLPDSTAPAASTAGVVLGASPAGTHHLLGDMDLVRITHGTLAPDDFFQLPGEVNLIASIDDDEDLVEPGQWVEYLISIENEGMADAVDAQVSVVLPPEIVDAEWECSSPGAGCTAFGTGDIQDTVFLAAGEGRVFYSLFAELTDAEFESVSVTVTATADASQIERDPSDNSATDVSRTPPIFSSGFEPAPSP